MKARPHIPLGVQRDAAILQLGLDPKTAELDHDPALALRYRDKVTGEYDPPANDPRYLKWRGKPEHARKTFKDNGTGRSDVTTIAKVRRLEKQQEEFRRKVLARPCGEKRAATGRWAKRKMKI